MVTAAMKLLTGVGAGFPVVLLEVDTEAENAPGKGVQVEEIYDLQSKCQG